MMRRGKTFLAAILLLGAAGSPAFAADAPAVRPGIVLMDFTGLAADQASLEKEVPGAVVFSQAVSQGGHPASAAASLLTAQYVQTHGLAAAGDAVSTAAVTLAEVLGRAGYSAAAFSADPALDARSGLTRGFSPARFETDASGLVFRKTWEGAVDWLSAQKAPFFLYIHGIRPEPEAFEAFRALRKASPAGTILALTAGIGPGGGPELGEKTVHVPLLVWRPALKPRRVSAVVRLVDLAAALVEWTGAEVPASFQGASLAALAAGGAAAPRYGFSASGARSGKPTLFAIRSEAMHMLYDQANGEARLYDFKADPGMKRDLSESRPEAALDLTQRLMRHIRETRSSSRRGEGLSPELLRQMREKGYW
ncbi:MAG: hypothetical protein HY926_09160 [Elusimicrobia bacterium]|nr:hypothetical protein [Elusimicrobiota bacterium]